jgi:hypothetical protein
VVIFILTGSVFVDSILGDSEHADSIKLPTSTAKMAAFLNVMILIPLPLFFMPSISLNPAAKR